VDGGQSPLTYLFVFLIIYVNHFWSTIILSCIVLFYILALFSLVLKLVMNFGHLANKPTMIMIVVSKMLNLTSDVL